MTQEEDLARIGADPDVHYDNMGAFMHQHIRVAQAILATLPEPSDADDALSRTLAVFQWLNISGYPELSLYQDPQGEHYKVQVGFREQLSANMVQKDELIMASSLEGAGVGGRWNLLTREDETAAIRMGELYAVAHGRPLWLELIHEAEIAYYQEHSYWLVAQVKLSHIEDHIMDDGMSTVTEYHEEAWEGLEDYLRLPFLFRYDSHRPDSPLLGKLRTPDNQTGREALLRNIPRELARETWISQAKVEVLLHAPSPERRAKLQASALETSAPKTTLGNGRRL